MSRMSLAAAVLATVVVGPLASGQVYLSGVVSYAANASGASLAEPAEFDNIIGTGNFEVVINGQARGTVFALPEGTHDFTFRGVSAFYNALSLYFADDGAAFNRPFASAPDLVVYGSSTPLIPAAGTLVQTNGAFSGLSPYSGATSFNLGGLSVSVTGFTFSNTGEGTFQLTVVPAPAAVATFGMAGLFAARRRR